MHSILIQVDPSFLCRLVFTNYESPGALEICSITDHNLTSCSSVQIQAIYPTDVVVTPDRSTLYVLDYYGNLTSCSVEGQGMNCSKPVVLANSTETFNLALSPDGSILYVTNYNSNSVQVCPKSGQIFECGNPTGNSLDEPLGIAISPNGSVAYIANYNNNTISICNISGQILTCGSQISDPSFDAPWGVALIPDGSTLYIANNNGITVSICKIISSNSLDCGQSPEVFTNPVGITLSPDGSLVYVTNDGTISSITICSITAGNFTDCVNSKNSTINGTHPDGVAVY